MNLTGERPGASAGGSAGSASCDFDNSSITSGILIYLLSVGCGKPGARSILFSNLLFRLDFSTLLAARRRRLCPYFGTYSTITCDFDNSSITSGILIITFSPLEVASPGRDQAERR